MTVSDHTGEVTVNHGFTVGFLSILEIWGGNIDLDFKF